MSTLAPGHAASSGRMAWLVTTLLLSLGAGLLAFPKPAQAATSLCPQTANDYLMERQSSLQLEHDVNLCLWSTTSAYGNFAPEVRSPADYATCATWADAYRAWKPGTIPAPGMTGVTTNGTFDPDVKSLGRDPAVKGAYLVQIAFKPVPGTAQISIAVPTWPGMTASQQQRVEAYLAVLLRHERGHQNLAGHTIRAYHETISVTAKTTRQAVATGTEYALEARKDATVANQVVQEAYEFYANHGNTQSALGGADLPNHDVCGAIDLSRSRFATNVATGFVPCQPEPWTTQVAFPSLYQSGSSFEETVYSPPPQTYQAHDRTSTSVGSGAGEECNGQVLNVDADVPGLPAVPGEVRTVARSVEADSTIVNLAGVARAMHSKASATVSSQYADQSGRLSFSGTVSGSAFASDTNPSVSTNQRLGPTCGTAVEYDFTVVGATSLFSLRLQGQWSASTNASAALTAVGQGWVEVWGPFGAATLPGEWVTKALPPGKYEFRLYQSCIRSGFSSTDTTYFPLDLVYTAKIEN